MFSFHEELNLTFGIKIINHVPGCMPEMVTALVGFLSYKMRLIAPVWVCAIVFSCVCSRVKSHLASGVPSQG